MRATLRSWPFWACVAALAVLPLVSNPFYNYLWATCLIFGILAMALDLLMGYTGLVSFGHAAFFGLGAYTVGVLNQFYKITSLWVALVGMAVVVAAYALVAGAAVLAFNLTAAWRALRYYRSLPAPWRERLALTVLAKVRWRHFAAMLLPLLLLGVAALLQAAWLRP